MKHTRLISLFLAAMMLLPLIPALAEEDDPEFIGDFPEESNVELILLEDEALESVKQTEDFATEPFIPEGMEKAIFGGDNRFTITNTYEYPYSAIAYLELQFACGYTSTASGFMVGPSGMVTAGHCVICSEDGCGLKYMTAYFGYRNSKNYGYKYSDKFTYWYSNNYQYNGSSIATSTNWDYAYIKLNKRVGDSTGWLGIAAWSDSKLDYIMVEVAGYRHGVLKTDWDFARLYNDYLLVYQNDTEPGNSGCPVIDADGYVVAINIAHDNQYNYGRRITSTLLSNMDEIGLFD